MQEVKVGIVGLGNAGAGTPAILADNADRIALELIPLALPMEPAL